MRSLLRFRCLQAASFALGVSSLAVAYFFMELYLGLPPCPLCVIDRLLFVMIAAVALLACAHNPRAAGKQRIYAGLNMVFSGAGIAVAARHVYLQGLAKEEVPDCLPDIAYMFTNFPFLETLKTVFLTSGECAEVAWTFGGLTIPQQTTIVFIIMLTINILAFLGPPKDLK